MSQQHEMDPKVMLAKHELIRSINEGLRRAQNNAPRSSRPPRQRNASSKSRDSKAASSTGDLQPGNLSEQWCALPPEERSMLLQQFGRLPRAEVVRSVCQRLGISCDQVEPLLDKVIRHPLPPLVRCPEAQAAVDSGGLAFCVVATSRVENDYDLQRYKFSDNLKESMVKFVKCSNSSSAYGSTDCFLLDVEVPIFQVEAERDMLSEPPQRVFFTFRFIALPVGGCCEASAAYHDIPPAGRVIARWDFTADDIYSVMAGSGRKQPVLCTALDVQTAAPEILDSLFDCTGLRRVDTRNKLYAPVCVSFEVYRRGEDFIIDKVKLLIRRPEFEILFSQWAFPIGSLYADLPTYACKEWSCGACRLIESAVMRSGFDYCPVNVTSDGAYGVAEVAELGKLEALVREDRPLDYSFMRSATTFCSDRDADVGILRDLRGKYNASNKQLRSLWTQIRRCEASMVQIETKYKNDWRGTPAPNCINNMCRADPGYMFGFDFIMSKGFWRGGSYEIANFTHNGPVDRLPLWRSLDFMDCVVQVVGHLLDEDGPSALRAGVKARVDEFVDLSPSAKRRLYTRVALEICKDYLDKIRQHWGDAKAEDLKASAADIDEAGLNTVALEKHLESTLLNHTLADPDERARVAVHQLKVNFAGYEIVSKRYIGLAYLWMGQLLRLDELQREMAGLRRDLFSTGKRISLWNSLQLALRDLVSLVVGSHFFSGLREYLVERSNDASVALLAPYAASSIAGCAAAAASVSQEADTSSGPAADRKSSKKRPKKKKETADGASTLNPAPPAAGSTALQEDSTMPAVLAQPAPPSESAAPPDLLSASAATEASDREPSVAAIASPAALQSAVSKEDEDAKLLMITQLLEVEAPAAAELKTQLADAKKEAAAMRAKLAELEAKGRADAAAAAERGKLDAAALAALRGQLSKLNCERQEQEDKRRAEAAEAAALRGRLAEAERRAKAAEAEAARALAESAQAKAEAARSGTESSALCAQLAGAVQTSDDRMRGMSAADLRALGETLFEAAGRAMRWHADASRRELEASAAARPLEFECAVCLERRPLVARRALCPCGHVFCLSCCSNLRARGEPCPNCRVEITGAIPVYDALQR